MIENSTLYAVLAEQQRYFRENERGFLVRNVCLDVHLASGEEVSAIVGVRRCGKSTLLRQIAKMFENRADVFYLNADDHRLARTDANDLQRIYELILSDYRTSHQNLVLLLDEIQNSQFWERWVNHIAQKANHKVFITGSNSKLLSSELATFLTGRHISIELSPFSFKEVCRELFLEEQIKEEIKTTEGLAKLNKVFKQYFSFGGFPRVYLDKRLELLPNYYNDIVTLDISTRKKVRNTLALSHLGSILATQNTRLFNRSKTSQFLGIKEQITVGKYCEYFKEAFLFYEIRQFSTSLRNQLRSLSKFYCVDHMLAKQNGCSGAISEGALFENLVYLELRRSYKDIFYWTSTKGYEVDFVISDHGHPIMAFQAAMYLEQEDTLEREVRALISANKELGISELNIITLNIEREIIESGISVHIKSFLRWAME